jgi:hypothetical protein
VKREVQNPAVQVVGQRLAIHAEGNSSLLSFRLGIVCLESPH